MKKISKFSIDELSNIRNSDEFKDLSSKVIKLSDQLQLLHIKFIALQILLNLRNLHLSDLLGYADGKDFSEFYQQVKEFDEFIFAYASSSDCEQDVSLELFKILDEIKNNSLSDKELN